jgi:hypothetical protein
VKYIVRLNNGCAVCFPRGLHQDVYNVVPDDEATRFHTSNDAVRKATKVGLRYTQFTVEEFSGSTRALACSGARPRAAISEVIGEGADDGTRGACGPQDLTNTKGAKV